MQRNLGRFFAIGVDHAHVRVFIVRLESLHIDLVHAKFAEEQEEGRHGDCVQVVLEIQESDTDCILISFYVLQRAYKASNLSPCGSVRPEPLLRAF